MAILVRDVKCYTIDISQLKALLLYAEQDIHDHDRQATAFNLLKAIITRKLIVPEINEVMEKVAELSITSELNYIRAQSRTVFHQFLMEYPLGNTLEKHLGFYNVLKSHSGTLLITLGARLVNDEVPECRKMVAECLSSMLHKLPKADRDPLYEIIIVWLKDRNNSEEHQRVKDHHLFQVLQLLLKVCAHCSTFLKQKENIESLAVHVQTLLAYPHDWVRLAAAQFLGFVLSAMDIECLSELLISNKSGDNGYLCSDPVNAVKSLTLDLCDQLQTNGIKSDLAEQVIKNLVFVARVLKKIPIKNNSNETKINLLWLTKRMRKVVNTEVVENSSSVVLRTEVFKWIAGVGTALDVDTILPVLHHLLAPLVREMITTDEKNAPLRQLSKEVANLLKKKVGMDKYTSTLSKLQQTLSVKRAERKRTRTQLAVTDPEMFAKKKIKRHEKKKESKKRKLAERKGTKRTFKKRKIVDLEDNSEIM
ncbi:hypothetical protein NQ314_000481 [Rhamnusium bicolor]|uniref:U3 small nucleolar RNA-associated protein 20 C-terminal domain-containing protein n=1 Tax=Rhamnusium bicolor TaxID=1586634 RepID=A0AAV8ZWL2_9CUCU|nr:hypothetical protein NQ314_000481 [Rhamnusium bicolor]